MREDLALAAKIEACGDDKTEACCNSRKPHQ